MSVPLYYNRRVSRTTRTKSSTEVAQEKYGNALLMSGLLLVGVPMDVLAATNTRGSALSEARAQAVPSGSPGSRCTVQQVRFTV